MPLFPLQFFRSRATLFGYIHDFRQAIQQGRARSLRSFFRGQHACGAARHNRMNKSKSDKGRFLTQLALAVSKQLRFESAFIITIFSPSKPFALHRIIASRRGQADEILSKMAEFYSALDAKGLAICGRAVSREWRIENSKERDEIVAEAVETFRKARKIAPHAGVVKSVLRLFDELVKCDKDGILKEVRKAAEGVT